MYPYMAKPKFDKNIKIPDEILKELLTASEVRMLKNRFLIINLLEEGLSIRQIAEQIGVGTDTVVRVARMAENPKLRQVIDKTRQQISRQTPWVFGKSEE